MKSYLKTLSLVLALQFFNVLSSNAQKVSFENGEEFEILGFFTFENRQLVDPKYFLNNGKINTTG